MRSGIGYFFAFSVLSAACALVLYLGCAFILWDLNPSQWPTVVRAVAFGVWLISTVVVGREAIACVRDEERAANFRKT